MRIIDGFAMVGASGVVVSPAGNDWTLVYGASAAAGYAFSSGVEAWVASVVPRRMARSVDNRAWVQSSQTVEPDSQMGPVVWFDAGDVFVTGGAGGRVMASSLGSLWAYQTSRVTGSSPIVGLACSDTLVVAVAQSGQIVSSPDGLAWTNRRSGVGGSSSFGVGYSEGLGRWVVAGADNLFTSENGLSWTVRSAPWADATVVTVFDGGFVVGDSAGNLWVSTSGTSGWVKYPTGLPSVTGVAFNGGRGVAVGLFEYVTFDDNWTFSRAVSSPVGQSNAKVFWAPITVAAPNRPDSLNPASGVVGYDRQQRFTWRFTSPDVGDRQTGFELRWNQGAGWNSVGPQETTGSAHTFAANTFTGGQIEWQVRVQGRFGDWSDWSDSAFVIAASSPPGPTIVSPPNNGVIASGEELVEWASATQNAFQLRRVGDDGGAPDLGVVYWDSGEIVSSSTREYLVGFPVNGRTEHLQLRTRFDGLWSGWESVFLTVSYTAPAVPDVDTAVFQVRGLPAGFRYTVSTPEPGLGEPTPVGVEIWRRVQGTGGDGVRIAAGLPVGAVFDDYAVASGVEYEIRVRVFGNNGTAVWSEWVGAQPTVVLELASGGFLILEGHDYG